MISADSPSDIDEYHQERRHGRALRLSALIANDTHARVLTEPCLGHPLSKEQS